MNGFLLWIAQGFGIGRIPIAPGTFGSVLGLIWFWLLLLTGSGWCFLAGTLIGLAVSVWLCGRAEKTLNQKDPGSVVLDEMAAMPVCFTGWLLVEMGKSGAFPAPEIFLSGHAWRMAAGVFVAFRFFDVVKPWPVFQSQSLPGGWGVTVDDALAAAYVNGVVLAVHAGKSFFAR